MNDRELQAPCQAQPCAEPVAYSPEVLERRGAAAPEALARACREVEEERVAARAGVLGRRVVAGLALWAGVVLLGGGAWWPLALLVLLLLVLQFLALLGTHRALRAVRAHAPGSKLTVGLSQPALVLSFVLALLVPVTLVGLAHRLRPPAPVPGDSSGGGVVRAVEGGPTPFVAESWPAELRPVVSRFAEGDGPGARELLTRAAVPEPEREALRRQLDELDRAEAEARRALAGPTGDLGQVEALVRRALELDLALRAHGTAASPGALAGAHGAPSRLRRELMLALASAHYERGKALADQKDLRGACLAWKRGMPHSWGSVDLLRAVADVCTPRAARLAREGSSCDEFRAGLDYAVDGDGQRDVLVDRLAELGCGP